MTFFKQFILDFFILLFPELCNACGIQLFHGETCICTKCRFDLPYTDFHLYPDNVVARLFRGRINCHQAMALLYFRKATRVQQLIHSLKYEGQTELGIVLGSILGERLLRSSLYAGADLVIPVPLHPAKERKRGYNQSKCIAEGIAGMMQLPLGTTQLIRKTNTGTQTKKTRYSRFKNMQAVFHIPDPAAIKGKCVILVDDVVTTGATLESCGQLLLDSGASKLYLVTLAFVA